MLSILGLDSLEALADQVVPADIRLTRPLALPAAMTEEGALAELAAMAAKNEVWRSWIGMGYHDTVTPPVILRNVIENPGWYTAYTPYQAEIAQGRLEALLAFQTMVSDLTGLPIANASLLDEATAAAEAMNMLFHHVNRTDVINAPKFFVDEEVFPQTKDLLITRGAPLGIEIVFGDYKEASIDKTYFGALVQYPNNVGSVE